MRDLLRTARWAALVFAFGTTADAQPPAAKPGRVDGVVFDSVSMKPLGGALVQLANPGDPTQTRSIGADSIGRFRFDSVSAGDWIVGAWHARLDTLGVRQFARRATVAPDKRTTVQLSIPSARTLITRMCGMQTANDSLGVIFGTLRDAAPGRRGVAGALRMQWLEVEISGGGIRRDQVAFEQATSNTGEYIACGVPTDARVQVKASAGADSSGVLEVLTNAAGIMRLDILVATPQRRAVTTVRQVPDSTGRVVADTMTTSYLTGDGRLDGILTRAEAPAAGAGSAGVPNALAMVWGTAADVRSDSVGTFTLRALPLGTHTVEVRAIGYEPLRQLVDVTPDEPTTLRIDLSRVTSLDTVRVRARFDPRNRRFDEAGFLSRQRTGRGVYRTAADLARTNPMTMREVLINAPFVQVQWSAGAGERITMGAGYSICTPSFWVDGREMDNEQFQFFVRANDVLAVEVYQRLSATPPQFVSPRNIQGNGCGAIVIWTGVRPKPTDNSTPRT